MGSATTPTTVSTATMPTSMTDAEATRLGLKVYLHNVSYNSITPTISMVAGSSLTSVTVGEFIPYLTQGGVWRLKFSAAMIVSSAARAVAAFAVVGVTTPAVYQAIATTVLGGAVPCQGYTDNASSAFMVIVHASATTGNYICAGDIALAAKPTWAY